MNQDEIRDAIRDIKRMDKELSHEDVDKLIRGKNINFLIGAGASVPMYPTLSFGEGYPSFEDVVSHDKLTDSAKSFLYMHYFKKWLEPMAFDSEIFYKKYGSYKTLKNYKEFINLLYAFLQNESNELPKRINIFTTNYDLVFERIFDDFLIENPLIYFNDGSRGFFQKYISNQNFYLNVTHSGYNDNFRREVPTINLFKLHGSLSWKTEVLNNGKEKIQVDSEIQKIIDIRMLIKDIGLSSKNIQRIIDVSKSKNLEIFIYKLNKLVKQLNINKEKMQEFNFEYAQLPIINPDKYKFSKTVLEQHYYQLIRSFSYELERKQSILIVFGFSFADEHIKDIFERSLLNPDLLVIMISYSEDGQDYLKKEFQGYQNIIFLPKNIQEIKGDFDYLLSILGGRNEK